MDPLQDQPGDFRTEHLVVDLRTQCSCEVQSDSDAECVESITCDQS